jgi:predicted site-specific integrase-resolvase
VLGVTIATVNRWAAAGSLPAPVVVTAGGHRRWRRCDIEALAYGERKAS